MEFKITGALPELQNWQTHSGFAPVVLHDSTLLYDDPLGNAVKRPEGCFEINYGGRKDFKEFLITVRYLFPKYWTHPANA